MCIGSGHPISLTKKGDKALYEVASVVYFVKDITGQQAFRVIPTFSSCHP